MVQLDDEAMRAPAGSLVNPELLEPYGLKYPGTPDSSAAVP